MPASTAAVTVTTAPSALAGRQVRQRWEDRTAGVAASWAARHSAQRRAPRPPRELGGVPRAGHLDTAEVRGAARLPDDLVQTDDVAHGLGVLEPADIRV